MEPAWPCARSVLQGRTAVLPIAGASRPALYWHQSHCATFLIRPAYPSLMQRALRQTTRLLLECETCRIQPRPAQPDCIRQS